MPGDARGHGDGHIQALVDLLCDAFTPEALRGLLLELPAAGAGGPSGRELVDALPAADATPRRVYARLAAEALVRRGLIAAPLWQALVRARPRRVSEIRALAGAWAVPAGPMPTPETRPLAMPLTATGLRDRIIARFTAAELADLVSRAFPELPGGLDAVASAQVGFAQRVHELVAYCRRRGWLARLAAAVAEARP